MEELLQAHSAISSTPGTELKEPKWTLGPDSHKAEGSPILGHHSAMLCTATGLRRPQCFQRVFLLIQAQIDLAPHTPSNGTLTLKQSPGEPPHWRQKMAMTGCAMIPAHYFSLPKDIKPVLASQVPKKRFSGFGGIPSNLSAQLFVPWVIRREQQTELQGTGATSDFHHPEKPFWEKEILRCKLHGQTGSFHVPHSGQVQAQKLTDVQQNVLSLNHHGNPMALASMWKESILSLKLVKF